MSSNWLNRIQQHAATPPEGAWQNIVDYLDNDEEEQEGFAAKLSALEIPPPATAQNNIFALLDAEEKALAFEQRVYHYEEKAPAEVWPRIVTALNTGETKIIPLNNRIRNNRTVYLRAAAAAVVITILSITAWLLSRQGSGMREIAAVTEQPQTTVPAAPESEKTVTATSDTQEKKTAVKTAAAAQTAVITSEPAYIQSNEAIVLAQNPAAGKKDKLQTATGETPENVELMNTPNSYISIAGPDGQSIRVSSKFSNLIGYLTEQKPETQENLDIIIKESAQWRATFAKWRNKMTNNAVAPALTNFMDIIELSNLLEGKITGLPESTYIVFKTATASHNVELCCFYALTINFD